MVIPNNGVIKKTSAPSRSFNAPLSSARMTAAKSHPIEIPRYNQFLDPRFFSACQRFIPRDATTTQRITNKRSSKFNEAPAASVPGPKITTSGLAEKASRGYFKLINVTQSKGNKAIKHQMLRKPLLSSLSDLDRWKLLGISECSDIANLIGATCVHAKYDVTGRTTKK